MCSNTIRIITMFIFVILAFMTNYLMPNIPVILWYFATANIFSFILFSIDKLNAIKGRTRVPETSFHFLSCIGGIIGVLLGVVVFRHKLNSRKFLAIELVIFIFYSALIFIFIKNSDALLHSLEAVGG